MKISFDYDGTLTKQKYKDLAIKFIKDGDDVYIITARQDKDMEPVRNLAKELGIKKVYNTNGKDKYETIKRLGIDKHYDDNNEQIKKINENTDTKGILVLKKNK